MTRAWFKLGQKKKKIIIMQKLVLNAIKIIEENMMLDNALQSASLIKSHLFQIANKDALNKYQKDCF